MIGTQRTGRLSGIEISGTVHEGLSVTANGQPALLAVVTANGRVLVAGQEVANEVEAVTVNLYQRMLAGLGHLRTIHPVKRGAEEV